MESIKKIDIHAHAIIWPEYTPKYKNHQTTMLTPERLFSDYYEKLNVEKCLLLPITSPEAALSTITNDMTKYLVDQNPDKLLWFCNVDPRSINNRDNSNLGYLLEHYKSLGAKGVGELTSNIYADNKKTENLFSTFTKM